MSGAFPLTVGNVILCEGVRPELNGKHSIMGVFSGDVLVPSFPGLLQVAIYVELFAKKLGKQKVDVEIGLDGHVHAQASGQFDYRELRDPAVLVSPVVPVALSGPGKITVHVVAGGARKQILKKEVRVSDKPLISAATGRPLRAARSRSARKPNEPSPEKPRALDRPHDEEP